MSEGNARILVVDDERGICEGCRRILSAEGYAVITASDGVEGLERFRSDGPFDLALVDLKMPRLGGMEVIEELQRSDETLAILVITAYATIETAVEATKRGAQSYVAKPFTPDELLLQVRNALEHRRLALETRRLREERERRLLELRFERSQCSSIIRCMGDGVMVVNAERQIALSNDAAKRMVPGLAGLEAPARLDALDCAPLKSLLSDCLDAGAGPRVATREIPLEGSTYMATSSPVTEDKGVTLGAVVALRDITELKKLDRAKSMFISLVSHEVKRPLAAIESLIEVLVSPRTQLDSQRRRDMLMRALSRAGALRQMVNELLKLSAIETGNFSLTRVPGRMGEIAAAAREQCRDRAEEKKIELALGNEPLEEDRVLADRDAMTMVLANLIDNAVKYTPEGGRVDVAVSRKGGRVEVEVADNGIGISERDLPSLFDEFYRATNSHTARVSGTGLGLCLVKQLVEMHQGTVRVESVEGEGSVFTVSLPALEKKGNE